LSKPPNSPRAALGREMYLLQLQGMDWLLGQTIAKLKAIGAWDHSLVVVTADHGVSFPFERYASPHNFDQILWTPLFVKAPNQPTGAIDDRPALSIDVLPTMADYLGVKIPWKLDGRSLRGAPRTDGPRPFMHNDLGIGIRSTFNGPLGFARVLRARAAPPGGDPELRIYRIAPYGRLVGRLAGPLVANTFRRPIGTITSPGDLEHVVPDARVVPWTRVDGKITGPGVTGRRTVALAVNGRIAGLAIVDELSRFHALLAPQLFAAGHNDVVAYLVTGRPRAPRLIPMQRTASATGAGASRGS
jgi:Sulfatase